MPAHNKDNNYNDKDVVLNIVLNVKEQQVTLYFDCPL